ncbi:MAG TPA: hybrid sensor histidine kinase/response regulator [Thermoanaerobaculia bacterium]|nr:hybrid sensor histidine kinase/response regulator [Thermoanaerobaculia bacterium]
MTQTQHAHRVLLLAPVGRDAELMCTHLDRAGVACHTCSSMEELCKELEEGAGVLLFTEEALNAQTSYHLAQALENQPRWSELPVLILTGLPEMEAKPRAFPDLARRTSITLLDRPVRIQSLISAVQTALNARARQYEVRDLMRKLEDRVHERDRFLAILGHELRNPLGAILLASQLVDDDGKLAGEHATLIERQSRHLTRIVNDLLDLSRVVSGKIVIKPQLIDLREIAEHSLETLAESARTHAVQVKLVLPEKPLRVYADPVRADQIINNVLTNAIKYTPEGGHVEVKLEEENGQAVICVTDDGVGIAPDRIGTIFELFAQAENAIGRSQGGMGIGLALVRNLVDLHGGSVSVRSDGVGKGCEFKIRFPLALTEPAAEKPAEARKDEAPPRRNIVIVEDNTDVRELLRLRLRKLGHQVHAVADGVSGVDAIVDTRPDFALIDIGLPRLDGYQVAIKVREELGADIVLVALSGFGQPEDKRRAIEAGFDDHITKPADVKDIESLMRRYPARIASPPPPA